MQEAPIKKMPSLKMKKMPSMKTPPKGIVVSKTELIDLLTFAIGAAGVVMDMKLLTTLKDRKHYLSTTAKTTSKHVKRWKEILGALMKGKVV